MTRVTHYNVIPLDGDGTGFVYGISDDGLKVVGLQNSDSSLFFWSESTGTIVISYPTGISFGNQDNRGGFSRDGSTVVGTVFDGVGGNAPFYWNQTDGVTLIPIPGPYTRGAASAVSHDGSVIAGQFVTNGVPGDPGYSLVSFIWNGSTTVIGPAFGAEETEAILISDDGTTVIGTTGINDHYKIWKWTSGGGFTHIGDSGGYNTSIPQAVSADGNTVVGGVGTVSPFPNVDFGFVWTSGGGFNTIGTLPGDAVSILFSVPLDGSESAGYSINADQSLQRGILCETSGLALTDLGAYSVYSQGVSISGDGSTIIMDGDAPDFPNNAQLWSWVSGVKTDLVAETTSMGVTTGPFCDWVFGIAAFFQGVSYDGSRFIGAYGNGSGLFPFIWTTETVSCECGGGLDISIEGVEGIGAVGIVHVVKPVLKLDNLLLIQGVPPTGDTVALRWSDDAGANWSNPVRQSMGHAGEYQTDIQWRNIGYARNRVIELSWSSNAVTALTGVFVQTHIAQS